MIVDTPPIATVMSHYDETGQPVACGAGRIPAAARTIATNPSLGIPCGALVILTTDDGRKYAFRRADSGPYVTGRLVDARTPAITRMGLPLSQGLYRVSVQWRKSARRCLPAWVRSYDHLPACQ